MSSFGIGNAISDPNPDFKADWNKKQLRENTQCPGNGLKKLHGF